MFRGIRNNVRSVTANYCLSKNA